MFWIYEVAYNYIIYDLTFPAPHRMHYYTLAFYTQPPTPNILAFNRAFPIRSRHIDRQHLQSMPLRILDNRERLIKTHRLVVERGCGKRRQVMTFEIGAGVSNQRKAGGVWFGKAVERERSDWLYDLVLCLRADAIACHALSQLYFDFFHARFRTFEAERTPQFFGFATAKARADHRHLEQLFLKERHPQRALQHEFKRRMRIFDRLASQPAIQVRMDHIADNRTGPNDRNLHDNVIKLLRPQSRETRHLRPTFDLKHANRVCLLQRWVNLWVVGWQMSQINFFTVIFANNLNRLFQHRHHSQTQQIDFDNSQIRAIFFVPLHDDAARHRRRLERYNWIELSLTNHHAAWVLAQVSRQILHCEIKLKEFPDAPVT